MMALNQRAIRHHACGEPEGALASLAAVRPLDERPPLRDRYLAPVLMLLGGSLVELGWLREATAVLEECGRLIEKHGTRPFARELGGFVIDPTWAPRRVRRSPSAQSKCSPMY
ncbi:MAG: hypothetical protein FJZ92_05455 [Chloroflexi bacterium]|nr:hypothetical protein [Chloroflexota bacterium]